MFQHTIKDYVKYCLRFGLSFRKHMSQIEETQRMSFLELQQFQNVRLYEMVREACDHVPFYRQLFNAQQLKPEDIQSVADLNKVPLMDKEVVRRHFKDLRNSKYKGLVFKAQTSGTTGSPGTFLRDLEAINFENAAVWRFFQRAGKSLGSRRVTIRGEIICPIEQNRPPFWRVDRSTNELLLSGYHIGEKNMPAYIEQIRKFDPYDLYAYPSTAYLLADYCRRHDVDLKFSAVFTSSEMAFPYQRETIEQAFHCRLWDWYGQVERVAAIGQTADGEYQIEEDYSIVELLPVDENLYEVVGTSLHNRIMPLIRYRTGDLVELAHEADGAQPHTFRRITRISGRQGQSLKTPDERVIGILNHIPRGVENLIETQFVQTSLHEIILRIVCTDRFSSSDEEKLLKNAREHISQEMTYKVEKVDKIERTKNGKFIPVISHLESTCV